MVGRTKNPQTERLRMALSGQVARMQGSAPSHPTAVFPRWGGCRCQLFPLGATFIRGDCAS